MRENRAVSPSPSAVFHTIPDPEMYTTEYMNFDVALAPICTWFPWITSLSTY